MGINKKSAVFGPKRSHQNGPLTCCNLHKPRVRGAAAKLSADDVQVQSSGKRAGARDDYWSPRCLGGGANSLGILGPWGPTRAGAPSKAASNTAKTTKGGWDGG